MSTLFLVLCCNQEATRSERTVTTCERAEAIATEGRPKRLLDSAMDRLTNCGAPGADAAARAFRATRTESDTLLLDEVTLRLDSWRDSAIFTAGMQLATDEKATTESRVFALRYLYSVIVPDAIIEYGSLTRRGNQMCTRGRVSDAGFLNGRALPSDYTAGIRALAKRLSESETMPDEVRMAAFCITLIPTSYQPPIGWGAAK